MKLTPDMVCLAMIANPPEDQFVATLNSVRRYVSSAVVVVAPDSPLLMLESRLQWFPNLRFVVRELDHSSQHRNYALARASVYADWLLLVDRGDTLEGKLPEVDDETSAIAMPVIEGHGKNVPLKRIQMVKKDRWRWMGRAHETLVPVDADEKVILAPDLVYRSAPSETTTSDNYERVLRLLKEDILEAKETHNGALQLRALFYLARTYHARGEFGSALETYMTRLRMYAASDEETFWCILGCARCASSMGMGFEAVTALFEQARTVFPHRAEVLKDLAAVYRNRAEAYAERARSLPIPQNAMYWVETEAYGQPNSMLSKLGIKLDS